MHAGTSRLAVQGTQSCQHAMVQRFTWQGMLASCQVGAVACEYRIAIGCTGFAMVKSVSWHVPCNHEAQSSYYGFVICLLGLFLECAGHWRGHLQLRHTMLFGTQVLQLAKVAQQAVLANAAPWAALVVHGFAKAPVGWRDHDHVPGSEACGYVLMLMPHDECCLFMQLGSADVPVPVLQRLSRSA